MRALFRLYRRRFHKLRSAIRMGLISMVASPAIRFWHWSAKWPWFTVLFFAALGVVALSEYALSVFFLFLSALGVFSKLLHWDGSGIPAKWAYPLKGAGSLGILIVLAGFIYIVVAEKGSKDWSHLQKPIMALLYHPLIFKPFIPTPDNWAAKQHFDTEVPELSPPPPRARHRRLPSAYIRIDRIEVGLLHDENTLAMNVYVKNTTSITVTNEVGIFKVLTIPTNETEKVEDRYPSQNTLEESWADFEVSRSLWDKMPTTPLGPGDGKWGTGSIEEIDDHLWEQLKTSGEKVVLLMHVVLFTDESGSHEIDSCQWIQPPFTFEHQTWRFCNAHNGIRY